MYRSKQAMCRAWNVPIGTYENRVRYGWTLEQILTGVRPKQPKPEAPAAKKPSEVMRSKSPAQEHDWQFAGWQDGEVRRRCLRCGMLSTWPGGRDWCVGWQKARDRMAEERRRLRDMMPWL